MCYLNQRIFRVLDIKIWEGDKSHIKTIGWTFDVMQCTRQVNFRIEEAIYDRYNISWNKDLNNYISMNIGYSYIEMRKIVTEIMKKEV